MVVSTPLFRYARSKDASAGSGPAPSFGATRAIPEARLRRLADLLGSCTGLLISAPLFLITAVAIWLTDHGAVFYRQTRAGLLGHPFELLKFRSMRVNDLPLDDVTEIREGHPLVTPVGRWLRRLKVDELPQLLNVLRGDMALIGPRPALPEHVAHYDAFERRRLHVRPGMTGWAQVNGGIELVWPERIMLDVWYVTHRTLWMDLRILWQTIAVIVFGERRNRQALHEAMAYAGQERCAAAHSLSPVASGGTIADPEPGQRHHQVATHRAPDAQTAGFGGKAPRPSRIVHLTSVHEPCDGRIFHKECRSLAMAGHDVTVIGPGSESDTRRDGVKIRVVPLPRTKLERMTSTVWSVFRAAVRENAEIYHFHDPELMPVGILLKARGKRVIYDAHEDFGLDMRYKPWIPRWLRRPVAVAVRVCEVVLTRHFDRVVAATPGIASKFPAGKARLVRNFPWTHQFGCFSKLPYEERGPIAVYIGTLSDERGLREMRQAVELAAKEVPIKLLIAGRIYSGANTEFKRDGESKLIEFMGLLNRSQVGELLGRARVGLFLLHPLASKVNALPIKLFEYMLAGLPVVASDFPDWRKMIQAAECGLLVDPLNPAAAAEALLWLFRHPAKAAEMGRNGQRAVTENYNWERESERLIATYAELQSV